MSLRGTLPPKGAEAISAEGAFTVQIPKFSSVHSDKV